MPGCSGGSGAGTGFRDRSRGWPAEPRGCGTDPRHPATGGGRHAGDTQQAIALAETVLSGAVTRERVADALVRCFRRDPRPGYGRRMQVLMDRVATGAQLLREIDPSGTTNGAAMRGAPVGLPSDEPAVPEAARIQASVSHDTPNGIASARAVAPMAFALRTGACDRAGLPSFLARRIPGDRERPWHGRVAGEAVETVRAALWAVVRHRRLADVLRGSIEYEGDVDPVATIALSVSSFAADMDQALPEPLLSGLENGSSGCDFLSALDARLSAFASAPPPDAGLIPGTPPRSRA